MEGLLSTGPTPSSFLVFSFCRLTRVSTLPTAGSLHSKDVQSKEAARRSLALDGVEIKKLLRIDCVSSWLHPKKDQVSSPEFWG